MRYDAFVDTLTGNTREGFLLPSGRKGPSETVADRLTRREVRMMTFMPYIGMA
jgi:hypothetical protein